MKCIFLGYPSTQKGYQCYSPSLNLSSSQLMSPSLSLLPITLSHFQSDLDDSFPFLVPIAISSTEPWKVYTCRQKMVGASPSDSTTHPAISLSTDPIESAPPISEKDLPIAIRKGKRRCTSHPICNYVSYNHLSHSYHAFVASLSSISITNFISEDLSHKPILGRKQQWKRKCVPYGKMILENWCLFLLASLLLVVDGSL